MTPQERAILNDAEDAVFQSANDQAESELSSGIRPPPSIEETESTLEAQWFGLDFGEQPRSTALPGASTTPPPSECPCGYQVTFHDVDVDCGCVWFGTSGSHYWSAGGNGINDVPFVVTLAEDPGQTCIGCELDYVSNGVASDPTIQAHEQIWTGDNCDGSMTGEADVDLTATLIRDDTGLWTLRCTLSDEIFFNGTTFDLTSTITNQSLACSYDPVEWPDILNCEASVMLPQAGFGGTATIEPVACGGCCRFGSCWDNFNGTGMTTQFNCEDHDGTYLGDGVPCTTC